MSLASRFNEDLCGELERRLPKYNWQCEGRLSRSTRECVDVAGQSTAQKRPRRVVIEAELKREDPASNVLKVWQSFLQGYFPNGVIFVQGFSKVYYSPKYHNRKVKCEAAKQLGAFIQGNTRGKLEYIPVDIPYHPRAGRSEGDGARRHWAEWFGHKIAGEIKRRRRA